jgi:UDP-N-acetylmuramoylalanine--D-glutamate ligase
LISTAADLQGLRVTVMGLGRHGGGAATARYLHQHGARVTVTDLLPAVSLQASVATLPAETRLVLGRHDVSDFESADLVIKNPGVPPTSEYLDAARRRDTPIETDISLFARARPDLPVIVVTGSKGKSTTAAAIHSCLQRTNADAALCGNITVSPLEYADRLPPATPVVLELSSFQLGDLPAPNPLRTLVSVVTSVMPDHLDRYPSMAAYVADKARVLECLPGSGSAILFTSARSWLQSAAPARTLEVAGGPLPEPQLGAWAVADEAAVRGRLQAAADPIDLIRKPRLPGVHNLQNLAGAALALLEYGVDRNAVEVALTSFPGLEHRLEWVTEIAGVSFINDSAATIPEATVAALASTPRPTTLLAGGNDKGLDFGPLADIPAEGIRAVMLAGSATPAMTAGLTQAGIECVGPYPDLHAAIEAAMERTRAGGTVLFSPGCTSFGMFANEFDRGRRFKQALQQR